MEKVNNNQVVIIKGEPGCGKSTRVPQYILENWAETDGPSGTPCRIAITQPRRIAALSLAERVAKERRENVCIKLFNVYLNSDLKRLATLLDA